MAEYLVRHRGVWHIAHPAACLAIYVLPDCADPDANADEFRRIRLAWADRDNAIICHDDETEDVKDLPE